MPPKITVPTGLVDVRNFDEGVFKALGGIAQELPDPLNGRNRFGYWVTESFTKPNLVPIVFNNPEAIYETKTYPIYLVKRNDFSPALQRWHSVKSIEYTAGITPETQNGVEGFAQVETKVQALPYDIFYTISCYARYEREAIGMMKRLMRAFRQYSKITVVDSLGENRSYSTFAESGVQDISEYIDVADRVKAYQIDIRVEGELDIDDPITRGTVTSVSHTLNKK